MNPAQDTNEIRITQDQTEMYRNYLNIPAEKRDRAIYRIMPIKRLEEAFNSEKLAVVRPKRWDDPFENWLLKGHGRTPEGHRVNFTELRDAIYGQCWTLQPETDAMWRIYSPEKHGVKVKTTIKKLLEALYSSTEEFPELSCFIGEVQYLSVEALKQRLTMKYFLDSTGAGGAETLLFKRPEFEHESEVRLIFKFPDSKKAIKDFHQFHIKPHDLFDELIFDPRMEEGSFKVYRDELLNKGYSKPIEQSKLYRPPEDIIVDWNF